MGVIVSEPLVPESGVLVYATVPDDARAAVVGPRSRVLGIGAMALVLGALANLAGRAAVGPEGRDLPVRAPRIRMASAPSSASVSRMPGAHEAERVRAFGSREGKRASYPYAALIRRVADEHGLPASLIAGVIQIESEFDPNCVSPVGAVGLMQVMPATARGLRRKMGMRRIDLYDPEQNVRVGTYFLKALLREFGGDLAMALSYYNAGRRGIISRGRYRNGRYIRAVIGSYDRYRRPGTRPLQPAAGVAAPNSSSR